MSKRLKSSVATYRRVKANREEHLAEHTGSIDAYAEKAESIGRVSMRKVSTSRKARPIIHNEKKDSLQFVSV